MSLYVEKIGKTLDFTAVANRVVDWLYSKRMSIRAAYPEMPFGTRAELAQKLAVRVNMATLLPMGLTALVSLLAYGSLMLWTGFRTGSGHPHGRTASR
ncbi:MAG: hypothetical protein LBB60_00880 [Desulfovibrio sp.]|nr:hypothetical protein [Desulfovibrio sp.]